MSSTYCQWCTFHLFQCLHVYFSEKLGDIQQAKCYSKWEAWSSILLVTCQRDSMLRWLTQSKRFLKYILNLFLKLSIWKKMIFFLKGFFYYYLNKITLCTSIRLCTKIKEFFFLFFFFGRREIIFMQSFVGPWGKIIFHSSLVPRLWLKRDWCLKFQLYLSYKFVWFSRE